MFSFHPNCKKVYIGQTTQPDHYARFPDHINEAFREKSEEFDYKLSRAIRKYGKSTWHLLRIDEFFYHQTLGHSISSVQNPDLLNEHQIIFSAQNQEALDILEILWIDEFNSFGNGYNQTLGGGGRSIAQTLTQQEIEEYQLFLEKGYMKTQIFSSKRDLIIPNLNEYSIYQYSYSQFCLRFAYSQMSSNISSKTFRKIRQLELLARLINNTERQQALANIIVIEKIMGIEHSGSIAQNKQNIKQELLLSEISAQMQHEVLIIPILSNFGIPLSLFFNIQHDRNLSLGRIGDLRSAILIDLFENNHLFSFSYFAEKFKSTREIIAMSPIQRGIKRNYLINLSYLDHWNPIDLSINPCLSFHEKKRLAELFPELYDILIVELLVLKQYLSQIPAKHGVTQSFLSKHLTIPRNHFQMFNQILDPRVSIRYNSKKYENYRRIVFIENILLSQPFISPKELASIYFKGNFTESDRKNLSRKLNRIKHLIKQQKRLSHLYLHDLIGL